MLSSVIPVVLLAASSAVALPWDHSDPRGPPSGGYHHGGSPPGHGSGGQVAFKFPLPNGFPNIKVPSAALTQIVRLSPFIHPSCSLTIPQEQQAHGTLPNGPLSTTLLGGDATIFELIAFNELFEVAFFTSLINNITNNVAGFETGNYGVKNFVLQSLLAVQAQEELHALGANGILAAAGQTTIQPCEYVFPSSDFESAINFARTFTDVVLGTLQAALNGLATNGDIEYVPLIGSVIGQEGEQNGYYRELLGLNPSELPFLTRSSPAFAFSALNQAVVVKGSCPNIDIIGIPIFAPLTVDTKNIQGKDQTLEFSFTNNGTDLNTISLVYVNQQNLPIVEKPQIVSSKGDAVTISAPFPFSQFISKSILA